jgi:hypothetical protein
MLECRARPLIRFAILVTALGAVPPGANADAVVDRFDAGGTFHPTDNLAAIKIRKDPFGPPLHAIRAAAQFTVSGGDFTLSSVTLPISVQNSPSGDFLRVRVTSDSDGAPGATLEVLSESQGVWPQFANPFTTTTTLASATHPPLLDGQSYWIVTEPTTIPLGESLWIDYRWYVNTGGSQVPVRQQLAVDALPSDPWPGSSGSFNLAFRVDATPRVVGVSDLVESGPDLELDMPSPNPAVGAVTFRFRLGAPAAVSCEVLDVAGRRLVSPLADRLLPAGTHHVRWDGASDSGRHVPQGIYLVRFSAGAAMAVRRFAIVD